MESCRIIREAEASRRKSLGDCLDAWPPQFQTARCVAQRAARDRFPPASPSDDGRRYIDNVEALLAISQSESSDTAGPVGKLEHQVGTKGHGNQKAHEHAHNSRTSDKQTTGHGSHK